MRHTALLLAHQPFRGRWLARVAAVRHHQQPATALQSDRTIVRPIAGMVLGRTTGAIAGTAAELAAFVLVRLVFFRPIRCRAVLGRIRPLFHGTG